MSVPLLFAQRRNFTDVANLENGHRCRAPPVEATIYGLKATGNVWEKFKSNFDARLISDPDPGETSFKQNERSKEPSLQIPVDFTREDVAKVRIKTVYIFKKLN